MRWMIWEVKRELEWQIDDIVTIAVYQVVFFFLRICLSRE